MAAHPATAGLILAGGQARRMNGADKALLPLGGRPLLAHVIERLAQQAEPLLLSANGDPARFAPFALPVVADDLPGHPGPLAGVLAGLDWLAVRHPALAWAVSAPVDCPALPADLIARLHAARQGDRPAMAASNGRTHPAIALWPVALRHDLRAALARDERRVGAFLAAAQVCTAIWPPGPHDPFANLNTAADMAAWVD
jgi:molybdopterin-guanine dinucleotide biosynthesis protein A